MIYNKMCAAAVFAIFLFGPKPFETTSSFMTILVRNRIFGFSFFSCTLYEKNMSQDLNFEVHLLISIFGNTLKKLSCNLRQQWEAIWLQAIDLGVASIICILHSLLKTSQLHLELVKHCLMFILSLLIPNSVLVALYIINKFFLICGEVYLFFNFRDLCFK